MEEKHDETPQGVGTLERQITQLLEQLQRAVRPPHFVPARGHATAAGPAYNVLGAVSASGSPAPLGIYG